MWPVYGNKFLDNGIDALKATSKKVIQTPAEATGEVLGNKIADKIVKPVEEIVIPLEKKE